MTDSRVDSGRARRLAPRAAMIAAGACLVGFGTAPVALVCGVALALTAGNPFESHTRRITRPLLQACVVLLGFGMDLPSVLRVGLHGAAFAAITLAGTMLAGIALGRWLALSPCASLLLSAGTAICGGSAIAAVSSVLGASEAEIAVSIGTVFLLNAVALFVFPLTGHLLHLGQAAFGLWAGVAIHDVSSVVGAGMAYGPEALQTATAVKLSRTLWIAPLTLVLAVRAGRGGHAESGGGGGYGRGSAARRVAVPWFIAAFLLASLVRSCVPGLAGFGPLLSAAAKRGMVLVLFLVGASLSARSLRAVGWRALVVGLVLWVLVGGLSLAAIAGLSLRP